MSSPRPGFGYEGGRIVPVTWHASYTVPLQLSAGRTVDLLALQRLELIALIADRMVSGAPPVRRRAPKGIGQARTRATRKGQR